MTLKALREIMPPPAKPVESGTWEDWVIVQEDLGTRLPTDYKQFINAYGTGYICGFFYVFNPFTQNPHLNLVKQMPRALSALRVIKQQWGMAVPYPLFLEPGGLLPWATTDNGDTFYWLTKGDNSDKWTVVIGEARGPGWEEFELDTTTFLTIMLSGEITSSIMGGNVGSGCNEQVPIFQPINPKEQK